MRLASFAIATGVSLALTASSAVGQSRVSTELFFARNSALSPSSSMYGLGFTFGGPIGVRSTGSAAFRARTTADGETIGIGAWTGELDLLLEPSLLGGLGAALPLSPYVFGGVGRISTRDFDDRRRTWTSASYGAGLIVPVARTLGVTAEGRYRLPLSEALDDSYQSPESSFPRGWEYRFGLSIALGG